MIRNGISIQLIRLDDTKELVGLSIFVPQHEFLGICHADDERGLKGTSIEMLIPWSAVEEMQERLTQMVLNEKGIGV